MKEIIICVLLFLCVQFSSIAQSYNFGTNVGLYGDLNNAIKINGNTPWDDEIYPIPIGFRFNFFGSSYDTAQVDSNGNIVFQSTAEPFFFRAAIGLNSDLIDRGITSGISQSPISYLLSGVAPNRIFKVEFKNAGFFWGQIGDFVNLQIWLYETSHKVELYYGSSAVSNLGAVFDSPNGPNVGLLKDIDFFNQTISGVFLDGNSVNPIAVTVNNLPTIPSLIGMPMQNRQYAFSPQSVTRVFGEQISESVKIYPNPVRDRFFIQFPYDRVEGSCSLTLTDMTGAIVLHKVMQSDLEAIDVTNLAQGIYLAKLESGNTQSIVKIVKK